MSDRIEKDGTTYRRSAHPDHPTMKAACPKCGAPAGFHCGIPGVPNGVPPHHERFVASGGMKRMRDRV
jgi:hypothetical protein